MNAIQQLLTEHMAIWTAADTEKKSGRGRASGNPGSVYGIKKLRELILELAVRGKLVPQDANDEPASELLKRIQAKKAKLIAEGKLKKEKPLAPITQNEKPFELPHGWEYVKLGDIAYSQAGFAFKSNEFNESGLGLPLIRIRDVGQAFTGTYYDGEYRDEFVVVKGDYLISMDGEFRVAKWLNENALLNQRVSRLIFLSEEIPKRFIAETLQAELKSLQGIKAYTTVDHLSGGQISNSILGLPPLAEQHRIVAKVDELMALCDQLEAQHSNTAEAHEKLVSHLLGTLTQSQSADDFSANWQRIAAHFDTLFTTEASIDGLKQTLLQLAVMGKLVPQDGNDEPAGELLKRTRAEKAKLIAEGKLKKEKPLAAIADDEKPFELPRGWEWVRLSDLVNILNGRAYKKEELLAKGTPVLRVGNLFTSESWYYSDLTLEEAKYCNKGDLLFAWSASFGPFIWEGERSIFHYHIWKLDLYGSDLLYKRFLYTFLLEKTQKIKSSGHGVMMIHMTKEAMEKLVVYLPPLTEQTRIVAKVDELMALCDELKTRVQQANQQQQTIANVLVAQVLN
jgi:type I restriction enzyme S subunit